MGEWKEDAIKRRDFRSARERPDTAKYRKRSEKIEKPFVLAVRSVVGKWVWKRYYRFAKRDDAQKQMEKLQRKGTYDEISIIDTRNDTTCKRVDSPCEGGMGGQEYQSSTQT